MKKHHVYQRGDTTMKKMFLVLVSGTFPFAAVNAQVQVAPPATPAASGQPVAPHGPSAVKESGQRSGHGHGRASSGVAPSGSAHAADPKSGSAAPQVPGKPQ